MDAYSGVTRVRWENRRIEEIKAIEARLMVLEDINEEFVKSNEFSDLFAETLDATARLADEGLRRLYTSTITAAAIEGPGSQVAARRVRGRLERLDPVHLHFLKALAIVPEALRSKNFRSVQSFLDAAFQQVIHKSSRAALATDISATSSLYFDDLRGEQFIRSERRDFSSAGRNITMTAYSPQEMRRDLTWQAEETLKYLWPEEFLSGPARHS